MIANEIGRSGNVTIHMEHKFLTSNEIYFTLFGNAGETFSGGTRYWLSIVCKVLCTIGRVETLLGERELT